MTISWWWTITVDIGKVVKLKSMKAECIITEMKKIYFKIWNSRGDKVR